MILYRVIKSDKIKNMTIKGKLKLVSALTLAIPVMLAVICVAIIYLTFSTGDYLQIVGMMEPVDNTNFAYSAFDYVDTNFRKQLAKNKDENIWDIAPEYITEENGIVYLQATKDGEMLFQTQSYDKPENYDALYNEIDNGQEKIFSIIDDDIIFRTTIHENNAVYEVVGTGKVRTFNLYERNSDFYVGLFKTNLIFILLVIIIVYFISRISTKLVFDRVEYSLDILSEGVKRIGSGDLNYRIKYDRNDEFTPICDSFNHMADELKLSIENSQKQENSRKELLMNVSHDIFSPLTSIKAYVEGIQSGVASSPQIKEKYLNIIKAKTEQIERLISELLFYSKLEYGETTYNNAEKIRLDKFIEEYAASTDSEYAFKNIQVSVQETEEAVINADKNLLSRLFSNIIDNSGKYSNKPTCHVKISLKNSADCCILKISDDGPGVSEASIDHIFEVFYRSDTARQQTDKGSGIGLSIVNNIVTKSLSGSIIAENLSEGGLCITIKIPTVKE